MVMKKILAKSTKTNEGKKKQTLVEHIEEILSLLFKILKSDIYDDNFEMIMILLVLFHDLGKINLGMQKILELASELDEECEAERIKELKKEIKNLKVERHNILSGAFMREILKYIDLHKIASNLNDEKIGSNVYLEEDLKNIIYKAVILHHGSFDDYLSVTKSVVQEDIYNQIEGLLESEEYDIEEIQDFVKSIIKKNKLYLNLELDSYELKAENLDYNYLKYFNERFLNDNKELEEKLYVLYIQLKGLLNLVDHGASAGVEIDEYYLNYTNEEIDKKLKAIIALKSNKNITDIEFNEVQEKVRELSLRKLNILTNMFTGGGKTVASYRYSTKKQFFLVPTKIAAEGFLKDSIYKDDEIGLLHGDLNIYLENKLKENTLTKDIVLTDRDLSIVRNYCNPYIIGTIDQILLAVFKYSGYEKVLAAIRGANITVDEVHLLIPKMFLLLLCFMKVTNRYFDVTYHLMTATMPRVYLEKMNEMDIRIVDDAKDIISDNFCFVRNSEKEGLAEIEEKEKRQKVSVKVGVDSKEIIKIVSEAVKAGKNIIIIKNTVNEAIKAFESLKKSLALEDINLLHSRFKNEDKKEKFSKILEGKGQIWVTTQSVEIALDLDFAVCITDLAPMESLIQRIGRVNRHSKIEFGEVYILKEMKDIYDLNLKRVTEKILKAKLKENKSVLTLVTRKTMLEEYYNDKKVLNYFTIEFAEAEKEIRSIYGLTDKDFTAENLFFDFEPYKNLVDNKRQASKLFRSIGASTKIILEDDFKAIKKITDIKEKRKQYSLKSIQISQGIYFNLKKNKLLKYEKGHEILVSNNRFLYFKEKGLVDIEEVKQKTVEKELD